MAGEPSLPPVENKELNRVATEFIRQTAKFIIKHGYTPRAVLSRSAHGIIPVIDLFKTTEAEEKRSRGILDDLAEQRKKDRKKGKKGARGIKGGPVLGN